MMKAFLRDELVVYQVKMKKNLLIFQPKCVLLFLEGPGNYLKS